MSRYDGLIIPRSYSEYINKTDAATLQQALQLSGVLSGTVAGGDNKAVKSSAVDTALKVFNINRLSSKDCNDAIPAQDNTVRFYYVPYSGGLNKPSGTYNWNIITMRIYYSASGSLASQLAIGLSSSGGTKAATRTIYITNNGNTYGDWVDL